ncbi:hypothetical protein AAG906_017874 [Vitis piasezkii]
MSRIFWAVAGNSPLASPWQSIIKSLNELLSTLTENFVSPVLVQKIFSQIFSYINSQLFNSLLLRRECCTFRNGEYVKSGLAELELWCGQTKEEYVGPSWDELKHIRQAVGFLFSLNVAFVFICLVISYSCCILIHDFSNIIVPAHPQPND